MERNFLLTYYGYKNSGEPEDYVNGYEWLETRDELVERAEALSDELNSFGVIDAIEVIGAIDLDI